VKCKYQHFIFQPYSGERERRFIATFLISRAAFVANQQKRFSFSSLVTSGNNSSLPGGNCKNINVTRGAHAAFVYDV
jgi:hypothetical protein